MLNKIKSKSKSKMIIIVNIFLIAILMVVAVYAWFSSNVNNTIDAYDIQVESDNALELSFDNTTWSGSLDLADLKNEGANTNVLDTIKFVEVTGDGSTFSIPQLTQKENYAEVNTAGTWSSAEANQDYLSFTVYMRSKDPLDVYFGSTSKASPASSVVTGANSGNMSVYGDFSRDCVVGALRVSAIDSSNTRKFVWVTNPEYHLTNTVGGTSYTMDTNSTAGKYTNGTGQSGSNFQWNDSWSHFYYSSNSTHSLSKMSSNLIVGAGNIPDTETQRPSVTQTQLATLSGTKNAEGYYTGSAKFNIWVEGCDTEARRALIDGKFNLSLVLDSFATE